MAHENLNLPADPGAALETIREASAHRTVVVFKKSPICPVSFHAEARYRAWLSARDESTEVAVAEIDVIAEKGLARGLVAELGIAHQSPQALIFKNGDLSWHGSHEAITEEIFGEQAG